MKRIAIVVLPLLIVGALLLAGCGGVPQTKYDEVKADLSACQQAKEKVGTDLTTCQTNLGTCESEKKMLTEENKDLAGQVADLTAQLAMYPQLKDPTYEEAVAFLKEDGTDKEIPFDHPLAAVLVVENAARQGIRCYWVVARLDDGFGYYFVGFNTSDKGWIYFCTSGNCGDQEVNLEVGEKLYRLNPQWGPPTSTFNDTIVSIHYLSTPLP